jgi:hypothetical protein
MMPSSFGPLLIAGMTLAMGYAAGALAADTTGAAPPPAAKAVVTHAVVTAPYDVERPAPGPRPIFRLFGLPVVVGAPVPAPYAPSAYRDLGGQPESGRDAVMTQGLPGEQP